MSYFGVSFDSLLQNAELFTEQLVTAAEQATATATLATSADVTAAVSGTAGSAAPTAAEPEPGSEDITAVVERQRSALLKSREKAARLKHDRDEAISFLTDIGVLTGPGASQPAVGSLSASTLLERWRDVVATVAAVGWAPQITLEQVCQAAAASAAEVATLRKENASLESRCRSLQTRLSEPRFDASVESEALAALRVRVARAEEDLRDSRAATERLLAERDAWRASASEDGARNGEGAGRASAAVDALIVRAEAAELAAAQMRDRLEALRLENEAAQQALRARIEADVSASQARVEAMAAQLVRAEAEVAALSARVRPPVDEEPGGTGAELQAARESAAAAEAALKEYQTAMGARMAELEAARSADALRADAAALSLRALQAELDAARSELAALRDDGAAEASRLRDELAASEAEAGRLRLGVDKEKAARTRAVEKARRVLREQADSHAAELASLRAEADQAAARQKGLEDELQGAATQLSSLTAARDALARQVATLEPQLEEAWSAAREAQRGLLLQLAEARRDVDAALRACGEREAELRALRQGTAAHIAGILAERDSLGRLVASLEVALEAERGRGAATTSSVLQSDGVAGAGAADSNVAARLLQLEQLRETDKVRGRCSGEGS